MSLFTQYFDRHPALLSILCTLSRIKLPMFIHKVDSDIFKIKGTLLFCTNCTVVICTEKWMPVSVHLFCLFNVHGRCLMLLTENTNKWNALLILSGLLNLALIHDYKTSYLAGWLEYKYTSLCHSSLWLYIVSSLSPQYLKNHCSSSNLKVDGYIRINQRNI